jgi:hypothetical protein
MSLGFKIDIILSIVVAASLNLWPLPAVQRAVNNQMIGGYVAGWSTN